MKKITIISFILSLTAFMIIYSCQREIKINESEFTAAAAKEWYYGTFKKSVEYNNAVTATGIKRYPDWRFGVIQNKAGYQIIEFPLQSTIKIVPVDPSYSESDKRKIINSSLDRVLFIRDPNGKISVRFVSYIPDLNYLARHNYDISNNRITQTDKDFSGSIVIKKWDGVFIHGYKITNGKITKQIVRTETRPKDYTNLSAANRTTDECGWSWNENWRITLAGHMEGDIIVWDYVVSVEYVGTDDWEYSCDDTGYNPYDYPYDFFDPCDYGYCGEGGGGGENNLVTSIVNNVDNPCLNEVFNKITSQQYKNKLSTMLQDFQSSTQINITISTNNTLASDEYGVAYSPQGDNNYNIELHTNILKQCSQEFIASVYFHEAIHVYLKSYQDTWNTQTSSAHLEMLTNYFDHLVSSVKEVFPSLPSKDSYCMILDCINNSDKDPNFSQAMLDSIKSALLLMIQMQYPDLSSESAIQAIADTYREGGTAGTRSTNCN